MIRWLLYSTVFQFVAKQRVLLVVALQWNLCWVFMGSMLGKEN